MRRSAYELREAAAYVRVEAEAASDAAREALIESERELTRLAYEVGQGTVRSVRNLDDAFRHARRALNKVK
jgi:ribosomal protein L15E